MLVFTLQYMTRFKSNRLDTTRVRNDNSYSYAKSSTTNTNDLILFHFNPHIFQLSRFRGEIKVIILILIKCQNN